VDERDDERYMQQALGLALRGWGRVSPNPMVGALVVQGQDIVGRGWHDGPGTPHAEVLALREAGERAVGATLVCTLEPCDRIGRTPPCTEAIASAKVARVVVATTDPNLGPGEPGLAALRDRRIDVTLGILEPASRRLNAAFECHTRLGRPLVVLKSAVSLDGRIAAADGTSRWITGPEAREDVQRLRAWADAVLVGAGTALADDPELTVRSERWDRARPPLRIVVDATGRLLPTAKVFQGDAPTTVVTTDEASHAIVRDWEATGAEVITVDSARFSESGRGVDLAVMLAALGKRDVQSLLVEGGATLAGSFLDADLVDRVVTYVAPLLLGGDGAGAPGMIAGPGLRPVADARRLGSFTVTELGRDLRLEADVHRDH
jgi:diaminohydroxyphosphoribosylaminopyrimidine deaminase/5-amino-6-(5-phosphoribosylamino)uracil reductase